MRENLFPYIYDFLSILAEDKKAKNRIKRIILFGSVSTGEHDKESDIDLFIDIWSEKNIKEVETSIKEAEKRFYILSEKKWSVLGIDMPIKCVVGALDSSEWKDLRHEIISSGMTLYGKFEELERDIKHYALFNYTLSKMNQKKKMIGKNQVKKMVVQMM